MVQQIYFKSAKRCGSDMRPTYAQQAISSTRGSTTSAGLVRNSDREESLHQHRGRRRESLGGCFSRA